jgi:hypothetical protein
VSSAYTAACTDFLRQGCIDKVDTSKYNKGQIVVKAFKADLGLEEVAVKIQSTVEGRQFTVIAGKAVSKGSGIWVFQSTVPLPRLEDVAITVAAKDKMGNVTRVVDEYGKKRMEFHDWRGSPHLGL